MAPVTVGLWAAQPSPSHQHRGNCSGAATSCGRPPAAFSEVPGRQDFLLFGLQQGLGGGLFKALVFLWSIGSRKRFLPCRSLSKAFVRFSTVPPCLEWLQNPACWGSAPLFSGVILSCGSSPFPEQKVSAPKCGRVLSWAGLWAIQTSICPPCPTTAPTVGNVGVAERKYRG